MENARKYKVGDRVYWEGAFYEVIGYRGTRLVLFNPEISPDTAELVAQSLVSPAAEKRFKVGDLVHSRFGRFVGKVTAIESSTNRVICQSLLSAQDRRRFAYLPEELILVTDIHSVNQLCLF